MVDLQEAVHKSVANSDSCEGRHLCIFKSLFRKSGLGSTTESQNLKDVDTVKRAYMVGGLIFGTAKL